eukprot:8060777-Lingulodinium_polyedra.AAC.2
MASVRIGSPQLSSLVDSLVSTSICPPRSVANETTACIEASSGSRCVAICEARAFVLGSHGSLPWSHGSVALVVVAYA